jgi:hypothetical protein
VFVVEAGGKRTFYVCANVGFSLLGVDIPCEHEERSPRPALPDFPMAMQEAAVAGAVLAHLDGGPGTDLDSGIVRRALGALGDVEDYVSAIADLAASELRNPEPARAWAEDVMARRSVPGLRSS